MERKTTFKKYIYIGAVHNGKLNVCVCVCENDQLWAELKLTVPVSQ